MGNDEEDSIKWFWEHYDPSCYSIWKSDYKFNSELSMVFMSCNLVGGMFQRLEKMKKNAFASAILFGENNNSTISGIWVWKGQELAFDLCEDWAIDPGVTPGRSWTTPRRRPRNSSTSTGSGRAKMRAVGSSTRARSSSRPAAPQLPWCPGSRHAAMVPSRHAAMVPSRHANPLFRQIELLAQLLLATL